MEKIVKAEGPLNAKIMLVGEAPGQVEAAIGKPFVGPAGQLLDKCLFFAGINRNHCFVTNVVSMRPKDNNFKSIPRDILEKEKIRLLQEINLVNPNVIVAIGAEALKTLTEYDKITNWRGSIIKSITGHKLIPIIHPAAALREYTFVYLIKRDLVRVKEQSDFPDVRYIEPDIHKVLSYIDLIDMINIIQKADDVMAFDIELDKNHIIDMISFCCNPNEGWSVDLDKLTVNETIELISEILTNNKIAKIAHNAAFDITTIQQQFGIKVNNLIGDTMLMHHCVYADFPKSLGFLGSIYTDVPFHKDMITVDKMFYNAMDSIVTYRCYKSIVNELDEIGMTTYYKNYVHPLIDVVIEMQLNGIKIDIEKRREVKQKLQTDIDNLKTSLYEAVGYELNPNSSTQLKNYFYKELGYTPIYNRKTGNISCDEEALTKLSVKNPSAVIDAIKELRKMTKILSTYINTRLDDDNRIRCNYNIAGTTSGRFSSSQTIKKTGGNLQNIPKGDIKSLFIPDDGYTLIEMDLNQAEARVVAMLANERSMIEAFNLGRDIHSENAMRIFGKCNPELRTIAKRLVHAANYGIGCKLFSYIAECSQQEAKRLLDLYFKAFPKIREWHMKTISEVKAKGYLVTPFGRKKYFFGRYDDSLYRQAISYVPQSTVADALNIIMHQAFLRGIIPLLQVHDSFLFQSKDIDNDIKIVNECAQLPISFNDNHILVIPANFKVGNNWNDMTERKLNETTK